MILALFAAAAVASGQPAGDDTTPAPAATQQYDHASIEAERARIAKQHPDLTLPDWLRKPTPDELNIVWPRAAFAKGIGGKAVLDCLLNIRGLLENCRVQFETPAGEGFGEAALLLAPLFTLKPARKDGVPVADRVTIPINWEKATAAKAALTTAVPTVMHPVWKVAPTYADMVAAYRGGHGDGRVVLKCDVEKDGAIDHCDVLFKQPDRGALVGPALKLAKRFRLAMTPEASAASTLQVEVTIRLTDPTLPQSKVRRILSPTWTAQPDPDVLAKLFPAQAAAKGVASGRSVVHCVIAADGSLTACKAVSAEPEGLGFGEAAEVAANALKINPWTDEGDPVDGATLDFAIRFERAEPPVAATPKPTAP